MMSLLVRGIGQILTMDEKAAEAGCGPAEKELGLVRDAAMVVQEGDVTWVGKERDLPGDVRKDVVEVFDAGGRVVMPGLVDCHTHLVFAGTRAGEFEMRSQGATYEEIARQGGGIASTVAATRTAHADELFTAGLARLDRFLAWGVTTVEAKSGYGLDTESELKLLRVVRSLSGRHPVEVVSTFLGAHVVPPEHRADRGRYLDILCSEMIPAVAGEGLAVFCDVFCEDGAFTVEESRRILVAGKEHGLVPKIHAEQLSRSGGALLAAELGCASADHLDFAEAEDAHAMAVAGVTAVLLPGATLFTGKKRFPDARLFSAAGATVALSTDFNPGSSHTQNLWLMGTLGCVYMGMRPSAALRAMTAGGATALGLANRLGTLAPGKAADFLLLEDRDWTQILYLYGRNPVARAWKEGTAFS